MSWEREKWYCIEKQSKWVKQTDESFSFEEPSDISGRQLTMALTHQLQANGTNANELARRTEGRYERSYCLVLWVLFVRSKAGSNYGHYCSLRPLCKSEGLKKSPVLPDSTLFCCALAGGCVVVCHPFILLLASRSGPTPPTLCASSSCDTSSVILKRHQRREMIIKESCCLSHPHPPQRTPQKSKRHPKPCNCEEDQLVWCSFAAWLLLHNKYYAEVFCPTTY